MMLGLCGYFSVNTEEVEEVCGQISSSTRSLGITCQRQSYESSYCCLAQLFATIGTSILLFVILATQRSLFRRILTNPTTYSWG